MLGNLNPLGSNQALRVLDLDVAGKGSFFLLGWELRILELWYHSSFNNLARQGLHFADVEELVEVLEGTSFLGVRFKHLSQQLEETRHVELPHKWMVSAVFSVDMLQCFCDSLGPILLEAGDSLGAEKIGEVAGVFSA